jgi:phage terminase large subunit-like protein
MTVMITTAGSDKHTIGWEQHEYAERVRDGAITDPSFLPVLYSAPDDVSWDDERIWSRFNPALGSFRSLDEMRTSYHQSIAIPARQTAFRQLYLCQWTESSESWIDLRLWDDGKRNDLTAESLNGRPCILGLDMSQTQDLTALVAVFPEGETVSVLAQFWCPEDRLQARADRDRVPYPQWAREGYITAIPGATINQQWIKRAILQCREQFDVKAIAADPAFCRPFLQALDEEGYRPIVEINQGFQSLTPACQRLEALVLQAGLFHDGHPILRWCLGNTVIQRDADGRIRPSKRRSTERIDGISALVTALAAIPGSLLAASVYEDRGVRFL